MTLAIKYLNKINISFSKKETKIEEKKNINLMFYFFLVKINTYRYKRTLLRKTF